MNLIIFYIFSALLIAGSVAVVSSRNPVHSVFFLIFSFFCAAGIFLLNGAEFLALLLVIIYVGAIAVLFLFVVMMLNIDFRKHKQQFLKRLPFGLLVAVILFLEIYLASVSADMTHMTVDSNYPINYDVPNIDAFGAVLYTDFFFHFQISGLILLLAMLGAVVLTHRKREKVRKQNISEQVSRTRSDSVKIVKVLTGKGV